MNLNILNRKKASIEAYSTVSGSLFASPCEGEQLSDRQEKLPLKASGSFEMLLSKFSYKGARL
jgi:hypothetical protein